jgi:hypothetical protein
VLLRAAIPPDTPGWDQATGIGEDIPRVFMATAGNLFSSPVLAHP